MPLYQCNTAGNPLAADAKAKIAKDITDIHCAETGAPPAFVHAFFFENAMMPPLEGAKVKLQGNIRAGRTPEQKEAIRSQMQASIATHSGIAAADIAVVLNDIPASWVMEGGDVFPEPGEEAAWLEAQAEKLAQEKDT